MVAEPCFNKANTLLKDRHAVCRSSRSDYSFIDAIMRINHDYQMFLGNGMNTITIVEADDI